MATPNPSAEPASEKPKKAEDPESKSSQSPPGSTVKVRAAAALVNPESPELTRVVALELLRHGPDYNQLLSPFTPYLALCRNQGRRRGPAHGLR